MARRGPEYAVFVRRRLTNDARLLSAAERQSIESLLRGRPRKEAAFELGVRVGTFARRGRAALGKLGVQRLESAILALTALEQGAGCGGSPDLDPFVLDAPSDPRDGTVLAFCRRLDTRALERLTPAERQIALLAVDGLSNAEMARVRGGGSPRTVANQIAAIFRKLGLRSRTEIVCRLARGPG